MLLEFCAYVYLSCDFEVKLLAAWQLRCQQQLLLSLSQNSNTIAAALRTYYTSDAVRLALLVSEDALAQASKLAASPSAECTEHAHGVSIKQYTQCRLVPGKWTNP